MVTVCNSGKLFKSLLGFSTYTYYMMNCLVIISSQSVMYMYVHVTYQVRIGHWGVDSLGSVPGAELRLDFCTTTTADANGNAYSQSHQHCQTSNTKTHNEPNTDSCEIERESVSGNIHVHVCVREVVTKLQWQLGNITNINNRENTFLLKDPNYS